MGNNIGPRKSELAAKKLMKQTRRIPELKLEFRRQGKSLLNLGKSHKFKSKNIAREETGEKSEQMKVITKHFSELQLGLISLHLCVGS